MQHGNLYLRKFSLLASSRIKTGLNLPVSVLTALDFDIRARQQAIVEAT